MKLDAELIQKLVNALKDGATIDIACDYVGINRSTFFRWQKDAKELYKELGEGQRKPSKLTPRQKELVEFIKKMLQATAEYELALLKEIRDKVPRWQGLAWILERRFRERYARRVMLDTEAFLKTFEREHGSELAVVLQNVLEAAEAVAASNQTHDEEPLQGEKLKQAAQD